MCAIEPLFVYGSLMERRTLEGVIGRTYGEKMSRATLLGFRCAVPSQYGYLVIVPDPGTQVVGLLLPRLSAEDMERLDLYEDVREGHYARQSVEVLVWSDAAPPAGRRAQTYVAGPLLRGRVGVPPAP